MSLNRNTKGITLQQTEVGSAPAYVLSMAGAAKNAVILHGYGSCKEEVLGLGAAVARAGWAAFLPDLPGHGAHDKPLTGENIREFAKTLATAGFHAAVGHSLGGRLAMVLGIKPLCLLSVPLTAHFKGRRSDLLRVLRARRVREAGPYTGLEEALHTLEAPWPAPPVLLLHAARDLPTCLEAAAHGRDLGWEIRIVRGVGHLDIISAPEAMAGVYAWFKER